MALTADMNAVTTVVCMVFVIQSMAFAQMGAATIRHNYMDLSADQVSVYFQF